MKKDLDIKGSDMFLYLPMGRQFLSLEGSFPICVLLKILGKPPIVPGFITLFLYSELLKLI